MPFGSIEEGIASVLTQQRDALRAETISVYIRLLGKHFVSDEAEAFDLETSVKQFIDASNQRRVLVLYGDAGSGKSSFLQTLTLSLLADYTSTHPIPLFISLPSLKDPIHRAVEETLENYGFNEGQIDALKERHSFVFICDGYDEIHQLQNLYMSNRLNTWQAKTLISCRSQYVYNKSNPDINFMPLTSERSQPHLLSTLYVAPFNEAQIEAYFALLRERGVVIPSDEELTIIPGLKQLITTPFLLHMTVEALPDILARFSAASSADEGRRLKQMELYDAFITQWFLRQEAKLKASGHITEDMPDKKPVFWRYTQALAIEMHKHDVTWVHPSDERFAVFFEGEAETEMIRSACPLKKSGELFGFWHQSLGTYFTVRTIYEEECIHAVALTETGTGAGAGTTAGVSISATSVLPPPVGGIHCSLMTENFSALEKFVDQMNDARFKARMFDIIEASKSDERYAIGAANAITILNFAGVMLMKKNWRGIRISGANLEYAVLIGSDLSQANLQGVRLFHTDLQDVNLTGADLTDADFSEMPPITFPITTQSSGSALLNVHAVIYHPNKPWIAIAAGSFVRQWDMQQKRWVGNVMQGDDDCSPIPMVIAYSPNGLYLASGCKKVIRQWSVEPGEEYLSIDVPHFIRNIAYSPDSTLLASGGSDNAIYQLNLEVDEPFGPVLEGHTDTVTSLAYSPDGVLLASGSWDKTVRVWRVKTGELLRILEGHTERVECVIYSPTGNLLASGDGSLFDNDDGVCSGSIHQWVVSTGALYGPVLKHADRVTCITYSPNGNVLASGSRDKTIRQWLVETGAPFGSVLAGYDRGVDGIAYSPDGKWLASASGTSVRQSRIDTEQRCGSTLMGHMDDVLSVACSPNGKLIASGSADGTVRQWVLETGMSFGNILKKREIGITSDISRINSIAYSPNGKLLAGASSDGTIFQWHVYTGEPFGKVLQGYRIGGSVESIAYSPDGKLLASGSDDGYIRQWIVETGDLFNSFLEESEGESTTMDRVQSISYSRDGALLASGSNHKIRQWITNTGVLFEPPIVTTNPFIECVVYSPNRELLASSNSCGGEITQWVVATGLRYRQALKGHTLGVSSLMYSPCGNYLASGSFDRTIRQWEVTTGLPRGPILKRRANSSVKSIAYTPNGGYLVSGSGDHSVCLWHASTGNLIWLTRSVTNPLVTQGLVISSVIGLQGNQLGMLEQAVSEATSRALASVAAEQNPETIISLLIKSHVNKSPLINETQWYVHLVMMNNDDHQTATSLIIEGVLPEGVLPIVAACPHIAMDIEWSLERRRLTSSDASGSHSQIYLFQASAGNTRGGIFLVQMNTLVRWFSDRREISFGDDITPEALRSFVISQEQADRLIGFIQDDFAKQAPVILASEASAPLLADSSSVQYNEDSHAWITEKLHQLGEATNDLRFTQKEESNRKYSLLIVGAYAGLRIAFMVTGAAVLDAAGHDSYQELHKTLGIKIAATSLGFEVAMACCSMCLFKAAQLSSENNQIKLFSLLAYVGIVSTSTVISSALFDKNLIGESVAALFTGMAILLGGLLFLFCCRPNNTAHNSTRALSAGPGLFTRSRSASHIETELDDSAQQLMEKGSRRALGHR